MDQRETSFDRWSGSLKVGPGFLYRTMGDAVTLCTLDQGRWEMTKPAHRLDKGQNRLASLEDLIARLQS